MAVLVMLVALLALLMKATEAETETWPLDTACCTAHEAWQDKDPDRDGPDSVPLG